MSVFKPKTNREVFIILLKQLPKQLKWEILGLYGRIMTRYFGKLTIYSLGNVGLGTTTPGARLMVNDLVSVQPLPAPTGIIYYINPTIDTSIHLKTQDEIKEN